MLLSQKFKGKIAFFRIKVSTYFSFLLFYISLFPDPFSLSLLFFLPPPTTSIPSLHHPPPSLYSCHDPLHFLLILPCRCRRCRLLSPHYIPICHPPPPILSLPFLLLSRKSAFCNPSFSPTMPSPPPPLSSLNSIPLPLLSVSMESPPIDIDAAFAADSEPLTTLLMLIVQMGFWVYFISYKIDFWFA